MTYKILLPQEIMAEGREYPGSRGYQLINGSGMEEEDIIRDIGDCDGIIVHPPKMPDHVFEAAKKFKVVARHDAGHDTVDLESAKRHGVVVLNAPIANSMSVTELTIFYMPHCSRNFKLVEGKMPEDYYWAELRTPEVELDGKTLGLIGVGNIGLRVALKTLYGLNMRVIAYDPYKTQQQIPEGVELTDDFDRIFKESNFVSPYYPTTAETTDFVGEEQLSMMKPSAYLINIAHDKLVDERAFYHALSQQIIAGAGVDVLKKGPFDANDPIFALNNIVIGPHIGAATIEATDRASLHSAIGINEVLSGKRPSWPVPGF